MLVCRGRLWSKASGVWPNDALLEDDVAVKARFAGLDWFRRETEGFVAYVKASPPSDPGAPVLVPGDPERLAREKRLRDGIEVDATTWDEIVQAAASFGIAPEALA